MIEAIFTILVIGLLLAAFKFNSRKPEDEPSSDLIQLPYQKAPVLLDATKQKFFHELETIVEGQYRVFTKVRLFDFIDVKQGMNKADNKHFEDKIKLESIDFLLCTPQNTNTVLAIELEDIDGNRDEKAKRNAFITKVCKDANVPLLHFKVRGSYGAEITKQLKDNIPFKTPEEVASE